MFAAQDRGAAGSAAHCVRRAGRKGPDAMGMKVAKTSTEEILSLLRPLNELEWLHKELQRKDFENVEWEDYEILGTMGTNASRGLDLATERDPVFFIEDLVRHLSKIHFQRILLNCDTLLNHCADPDAETLEFNADIKKGLELLREWVNAEPARRKDFPVEHVKHADLERIGDSAYTSQCPSCDPGTLTMRRDPETQALLAEDMCLYCGQRVVYEDVPFDPSTLREPQGAQG